MPVKLTDPIIKAIISDMSKMAFKLEGLEKQFAEAGFKEVAAAPPPEPTHPDELPGPTDLDQFKPEGFKGDAEGAPPADKTPEEIKKKAKDLFDGVELTEEQMDELEEDEDEEDEFDVDETNEAQTD